MSSMGDGREMSGYLGLERKRNEYFLVALALLLAEHELQFRLLLYQARYRYSSPSCSLIICNMYFSS